MPINIEERFQVKAPIDAIWRFMMDPQQVVACMPGAELEEVVDERTFLGNIKIKVGPITTGYKGRLQFTEVDEKAYTIRMTAEGRETGGGMAMGSMSSRLQALPDGQTEVVVESSVDISGRIMQFGRGMIQDVSRQLFQQFADCVKQRLEAPQGVATAEPVAAGKAEPIAILPLALGAFSSAISRFFRRLTGRAS